jgi:phosphate transport system substrate-binding protein
MRRPLTVVPSVLALLLAATAGAASEDRVIRIVGSGAMVPFLEIWAEQFEQLHPGVRVAVEAGGSGEGPPALLEGRAQIASMTRPMNSAELEAFHLRWGRIPTEVAVAYDAIAVFVNARNPLERLTLAEVDAIFSKTLRCGAERAATHWGDLGLGSGWDVRSIGLYGSAPDSGTYDYFREVALCGGQFRDSIQERSENAATAMAVAENPFGIGYGSRPHRVRGVKSLALARRKEEPYATIAPSDVYSGAYPLARQLSLCADLAGEERDPLVAGFIDHALSEAGQRVVEQAGRLPVPRPVANR